MTELDITMVTNATINDLYNKLTAIYDFVADTVNENIVDVGKYLASDISYVANRVTSTTDTIRSDIRGAVQGINNTYHAVYAVAGQITNNVINSVNTSIAGITAGIAAQEQRLKSTINDVATKLNDAAGKIAADFAYIENYIGSKYDATKQEITDSYNDVKAYLDNALQNSNATITGLINNTIDTIVDKTMSLSTELQTVASDTMSSIISTGTEIKDKFVQTAGEVKEYFSTFFEDIIRFFQDLWAEVKSTIKALFEITPEEQRQVLQAFLRSVSQ